MLAQEVKAELTYPKITGQLARSRLRPESFMPQRQQAARFGNYSELNVQSIVALVMPLLAQYGQ